MWSSSSCSFTILPNSFGLPALPLRMISVDGSNRLRILPSACVSARKMRALVRSEERRVGDWSSDVCSSDLELVRLAGLALANDLGRWLEQAEDLAFGMCVAAEDARPRLLHHLLDQRHHGVELLAQSFERQLLQGVPRALGSTGDLFGEPLRLSHHSAGRV